MVNIEKNKLKIILLLVFLGILYRLIEHPYNFSPLGAIAIFAGFSLRKKIGSVIPLAILFISDIFLGFYVWQIMIAVYVCFSINVLLGSYIGKQKLMRQAFGISVLGSIIFFLLTNTAVWAFGNWYSHDIRGLIHCFFMALPFFRNSLAGDIFFTTSIFGMYKLTSFAADNFKIRMEKIAFNNKLI